MAVSPSKWNRLSSALRSWPAGAAAFAVLVLAVCYRAYSEGLDLFGNTDTQQLLDGHRLPQYSMFTSSFVKSIVPLVLLALVLGFLALRFSNAIAKSRRIALVANANDDESGASAVEFVLVLPALAVLLLMILQIALIVQAKFVVNYAAFCAARSAVVVIPDEVSGRPSESRNQIADPDSSNKTETIQHSAALPLTAISPLPGFSVARGVPVLTNPAVIADLIRLAPFDVTPRSMMGQVMLRAPYAYHLENTAVKVVTPQGTNGGSFRDHDWVTVQVQYRYYLAVPFAKKLFGTSYSGNPFWNMLFGTDYYYPIVEQYTLPLDGEPMLP